MSLLWGDTGGLPNPSRRRPPLTPSRSSPPEESAGKARAAARDGGGGDFAASLRGGLDCWGGGLEVRAASALAAGGACWCCETVSLGRAGGEGAVVRGHGVEVPRQPPAPDLKTAVCDPRGSHLALPGWLSGALPGEIFGQLGGRVVGDVSTPLPSLEATMRYGPCPLSSPAPG